MVWGFLSWGWLAVMVAIVLGFLVVSSMTGRQSSALTLIVRFSNLFLD